MLFRDWTGSADRPYLHHGMLGGLTIELRFQNNILGLLSEQTIIPGLIAAAHVNSVAALFRDIGDRTETARTKHDFVVINERVLVDASEDVTSRDVIADL